MEKSLSAFFRAHKPLNELDLKIDLDEGRV